MAAITVGADGTSRCVVEAPGEVDAGCDLTVKVRVLVREGLDPAALDVSIRDEQGAVLAETGLARLDDGAHGADVVLAAPLAVGERTWRAALLATGEDGSGREETSTAFTFVVKAHGASLNVWGLPSAIPAGEPFTLKVGIKCSAGCKLAGRELTIFDQAGTPAGGGSLPGDIWPGTAALHFVEVKAKAPGETGVHRWLVETAEWHGGAPHAPGSFPFSVRVVSAPECEVTVEAIDVDKQAPVKGAHVLLHPYRAFTDEDGIARVKVAKGRYTLHVSGFKYIAWQDVIDVAGDVRARAELALPPPGSQDYGY
jgi:hypothetical protein